MLVVLCLIFYSFLIVSLCDVTCDPVELDPTDSTNYCSFKQIEGAVKKGTWCLVRPERIFPTQIYVGVVEMQCTKKELEGLGSSDLRGVLTANSVPSIIGPGGNLYITDHHHFARALWEAFLDFKRPDIHRVLYACVQDDFSHLSVPQFWEKMEADNLAFLRDEHGRNISYTDIPTSVKLLRDNPYRSMASWLRKSNGFIKCGKKGTTGLEQCQNKTAPYFLECLWAEYMSVKFPLSTYPEYPVIPPPITDFIWKANLQSQVAAMESILRDVLAYATSPVSAGMPGFNLSKDKMVPKVVSLDEDGCITKDYLRSGPVLMKRK